MVEGVVMFFPDASARREGVPAEMIGTMLVRGRALCAAVN